MSNNPTPLSATATGKALGLPCSTVMKLYREGILDAEIHEGRVIKFDVAKCRAKLAARAKKNRKEVATPLNGMVTTY